MGKSKKAPARPAPQGKPSRAPGAPGSLVGKTAPVPRGVLPDTGSSEQRLCWRFRHADPAGKWCVHDAGPDLRTLVERMANFESMTIGEAFPGSGYPGKDYDVDEIPTREVLDRLEELGLADMTRISVLRLSGERRLYGFRDRNVFHIVWWDPGHEIWPSRLKHT